MFLCGREEPIQVNGMLHAHNERPSAVGAELSTFVDPRLNRYSFVWFADESGGTGQFWDAAAFSRLLSAILNQWNTDLTWVMVRRYFPPGEGVARIVAFRQKHNMKEDAEIEMHAQQAEAASQVALKQFSDEGWATFHDDALLVATKGAANIEKTFALPSFGRDYWRFLIFGSAPPPETFARPPLRASVENSGVNLRPSRQFLAWLADHAYTIGYKATDDINRLGLVVVGTRRIDVERLIAQGVVKGIEAIPENVWRNGPSFRSGRLS